MPVRVEVLPYIELAAVAGVAIFILLRLFRCRSRASIRTAAVFWIACCLLLCAFFRDPDRTVPADAGLVVSGADGVVDCVEVYEESEYLNTEVVRVTVFLNLHNVHVNRAPIGGTVRQVEFRDGEHLAAYRDDASHLNQCNTLVIEGETTRCVVHQLVGAVVRRVVTWVEAGQPLARGERFGMMKFGSRLDVVFPREDVEVLVHKGDRVVAGESVIARLL